MRDRRSAHSYLKDILREEGPDLKPVTEIAAQARREWDRMAKASYSNVHWRFIDAITLLCCGHLEFAKEVLANYRPRSPRGSRLPFGHLVRVVRDVIPLPDSLDPEILEHHDAIREWLEQNGDKLRWRGPYEGFSLQT